MTLETLEKANKLQYQLEGYVQVIAALNNNRDIHTAMSYLHVESDTYKEILQKLKDHFYQVHEEKSLELYSL